MIFFSSNNGTIFMIFDRETVF